MESLARMRMDRSVIPLGRILNDVKYISVLGGPARMDRAVVQRGRRVKIAKYIISAMERLARMRMD